MDVTGREFAVKNCVALKEAREALTWLRLIGTDGRRSGEPERLMDEANQIVAILSVIVRTAR